MSVILINPPWRIQAQHVYHKLGSCNAPLGLAYIAAILEKSAIPVKILDCQALDNSFEDLKNHLARENPAIVGIYSVSTFSDMTLQTAKTA
jgi:hypothetical protein